MSFTRDLSVLNSQSQLEPKAWVLAKEIVRETVLRIQNEYSLLLSQPFAAEKQKTFAELLLYIKSEPMVEGCSNTGELERLYQNVMASDEQSKHVIRAVGIELLNTLTDSQYKQLITSLAYALEATSNYALSDKYESFTAVRMTETKTMLENNVWLIAIILMRYTDFSIPEEEE